MMTLDELAHLVKDMRDSQKVFFRDHSPQALNQAKDLERRVDKACREIVDKQPNLFE